MAPIRNHARHSRYSSNFASSSGSPGYRSNGGSRWDAGEVEDGLHPDFVWPEGHRPGQGPCDHILPAFYEVDGPPVVDLQAFRSLAATIVNMYNRGGQVCCLPAWPGHCVDLGGGWVNLEHRYPSRLSLLPRADPLLGCTAATREFH